MKPPRSGGPAATHRLTILWAMRTKSSNDRLVAMNADTARHASEDVVWIDTTHVGWLSVAALEGE